MWRFATALLSMGVAAGWLCGCAHKIAAPRAADVVITLKRGACLGSCPAYDLTLYGDGTVIFVGHGQTAYVGEKHYRIDPGEVAELYDFIDTRRFWELNDKYAVGGTDQVFIDVCVADAARKKCVVDYSGLNAGMPQSVRDIETEIDRVAKSAPLVGKP